jgi:hypothetical protein
MRVRPHGLFLFFCQIDKSILMVLLGIGQFTQEVAYAGGRNSIAGFSIEPPCFRFHSHCRGQYSLRSQNPVEPNGSALNEPFYVLSSDERDMVAIFQFVCLKQSRTVSRFLLAHCLQDRCGRRMLRLQLFGKIPVNTTIFFFKGDSQGENLSLFKFSECFAHFIAIVSSIQAVSTPAAPERSRQIVIATLQLSSSTLVWSNFIGPAPPLLMPRIDSPLARSVCGESKRRRAFFLGSSGRGREAKRSGGGYAKLSLCPRTKCTVGALNCFYDDRRHHLLSLSNDARHNEIMLLAEREDPCV